MKRTGLKVIAILMVMISILSVITACGSSNSTTAGTTSTQVTEQDKGSESTASAVPKVEGNVDIVFPGEAPKDLDNVVIALQDKLAKDGLDLKLKFTYFPWDSYSTKVNIIPASGEAHDLVWTHTSTIAQLVAKGALTELDDLLNKNASDLVKAIPEASWKDSSIGGKIYGIPTYVPNAEDNRFFALRGDIREKLGLPQIKTLADLENFMDAAKKADPKILFNFDPRPLLREFGNVATPYGDNGGTFAYIDPTDANMKVQSYYESDIYKNLVNTARKWYNKGWLPKPNEIKDTDAAFRNGQLGFVWGSILRTSEQIDAFKKAAPSGSIEDVFLNPDKPKYIYQAASNLISLFSTSTNQNQAIALMNWVRANQENYDLFSLGVKDVNYKLDGEAVDVSTIAPEKTFSQIFWAWDDIRYKRFSKALPKSYIDNLKVWDSNAVKAPTLGFKFNVEPVKTEIAQIAALETQYVYPAYQGYVDYDKSFPEFIKKLKAAGLEKVLAEMQKQVDAFKASK